MANIAAALRSRNPSGGLEKKFLEVPKADDGHLSCSSMQDAGDRYRIVLLKFLLYLATHLRSYHL